MLWLLYIAAVHISASSASEADAYCANGTTSQSLVEAILLYINNRRLILASGLQVNKDGDQTMAFTRLPPAKNMPEMTYDCALEEIAGKNVTDTDCELADGNFHVDKCGHNDVLYQLLLLLLRVEASGFYILNRTESVNVMGYETRTYANLMRADATRIGCASGICPSNGNCFFHCVTNLRGIQSGDLIYEIGTAKVECDPLVPDDGANVTYTEIFSDADLSDAPYCSNGSISKNEVYQAITIINDKRAIMAGGLQVDPATLYDKVYIPRIFPSARYAARVAYDCALEQDAIKAATEVKCGTYSETANVHIKDIFGDGTFSRALWSSLEWIQTTQIYINRTAQSLIYYNDDRTFENFASLMLANASRIGCTSTCSGWYLCITNQKSIQYEDSVELYEIGTDNTGAKAKCGLPWISNSSVKPTPVYYYEHLEDAQFTTTTMPSTTAEAQSATKVPTTAQTKAASITACTKKPKSTIQCVTTPPCATYPPHAKFERKARAANFRDALATKSEKHISQKVMKKIDTAGQLQNAR